MAETDKDRAVDLGIYAKPAAAPAPGMDDGDKMALALALLWLIGSGLFFLMFGQDSATGFDPLRLVITLMAVFLPVALIWVGAAATRSARVMREESARLHLAIDGIRNAYLQSQKTAATGASPEVARKLNEIVEQQRKTETALATFISIRPSAPPASMPAPIQIRGEEQASLALGTPSEALATPLDTADFISALQFPENPEDKEGFRALRRALQDRTAAQLVQAAQDVLTLLSQDGIYMDDLRPDRARVETWRKFAQGERGRAIAPLGGIRDRSSLALSGARMRNDTIFRDATHHFLRKFDHTFATFEKSASDAEIAALTDTRTARAFMLLGRVTGTFD